MKGYVKPMVLSQEETGEGVYMASGDESGCQSKYRMGVYQQGISWGVPGVNKMKERGCEGCPAEWDGACRIDRGPFGLPLMPTWEREGYDPEDDYVYK